MVYAELIMNLSLLVALSIVSGFIEKRWPRQTLWGGIAQGALFGAAAVLGMLRPLNLGAGLIFDGRSVMVSLCALFFGPWAAAISSFVTISCRIWLGGVGILTGSIVILSSAIIGVLSHRRFQPGNNPPSVLRLYQFGLLVHAAMLASMLTLPGDVGLTVIMRIGLPVMLLYPLATVLAGKILSDQVIAEQRVKNLANSEERHKQEHERLDLILKTAQDGFWIVNASTGQILDVNEAAVLMLGYTREEFVKRRIKDIDAQWSPGEIDCRIKKIKEAGSDVLETRHRAKAGNILVVEIKINYMPAADMFFAFIRDITERRRNEEALKQSEEHFRTLTESAPDAIFVQCDGRFVFTNPALLRLLGASHPDELRGQAFRERVAPEYWDAIRDRICLQRETGKPAPPMEQEYLRLDGSRVPVETTAVAIRFADADAHLVFVRDITQRKQAEEQIRKSQALLNESQRIARLGSWELDLTTHNLIWSDEVYRIFGLRPQGFTPTYEAFLERIHPDDRVAVDAAYAGSVRAGQDSYEIDHRIVREDTGEIRIVHEKCLHTKDEHGTIVRSAGMVHDITERKRVEEQLIAEKAWSEAIISAAPNIIVGLGERSQILLFNAFAEELTGFKAEEVMGREWIEIFIPPGMRRELYGVWNEIVTNLRIAHRHENLIITKTGEQRLISWNNTILTEENRFRMVLAIGEDITDRRKDEEQKEKLQDQLLQAQKMESVGRLAGGVAHDFNNMLGVIIGRAEMAMEEAEPTHPIQGNLREIMKAAERSAELTRQLLAFARKQMITPRLVDLNETVEGMLKMLRRLIGEDIDLVWQPASGRLPLLVDPAQVDQILANLCVNARDAISGIGKITIETGRVAFDEEYCQRNVGFSPGDYLMLAVSDDGLGMDKGTMERLFEPFFTTKEVGKGTGLGLAMVYGIVKQNKGFINIYSEPGEGTTIKIYLPPYVGAGEPAEKEAPAEATAGGQETILLVEDEPQMLNAVAMLLRRQGYTVLPCATPAEAIHLVERYEGKIDLLLTDVVMPEMNGRELAERLQSRYPDLRCLFMSGYTANVIAHHGVLEAGVHFIQKPFTVKDIAAKVRAALAP